MKTITEQLADALRALQAQHCTHFEGSRWKDSDDDAQAAADRALAAYDTAQTTKGTVKSNREWREECTLLRAALLQAQPQIRHLRQALERNGNVVAARDHRKTEDAITRALAGHDAQKPAGRDGAWWLDLLAKYVDEQKGKAAARGDKEAAGVLVNIGAYLILVRTDGRGE